MAVGGGHPQLDWESLVARSRYLTSGTCLAPEASGVPHSIVRGFEPVEPAPPLPGNVVVVNVQKPRHRPLHEDRSMFTGDFVAQAREMDTPCDLCMVLGRTEATPGHTLDRCYGNPKSPDCKPRTARLCMS